MSNIDKQALRGQSVEGSFYLVECCNCGEMYPSNLLGGGEAIADSGDYGDCYCHLCGADDTERADWGDVNSNEAKAWNFQQKRIEALLDELEASDALNKHLELAIRRAEGCSEALRRKLEAAEERIAELSELPMKSDVEKKQPQNTLSGRPVYLGDGSDTKEKVIAGKRDIHRYESLITDRAGKGD
ncbi:ead/Ea22-like family protein [Enterobacter asburiae]|uniref:ead/Ea22-like family protein n=1 Tax=Enterobacter asburiae TaxID=61645 RepID=UPI0018E9BD2F|nr:ead/Ea22-like family protein [Enterobacter asburiae]MBJ3793599.1 ead/Ea22-like family protein [Enterobacter asburiae]